MRSRPGDTTVVKDRVGRNRYIAFRIEGGEGLQTGEVIRALTEVSQHQPKEAHLWLVHLEDGVGIVRVSHLHRDTALGLLRSVKMVGGRDVKVHTLGTSGTIRKLTRKFIDGSAR